MTAFDEGNQAALFVTNVLNGTVAANGKVVNQGTVLRLDLDVPTQGQGQPTRESTTLIGSGFPERTDPAALVIGPTGVGLGEDGTLYVADTLNNRIAAIPNAVKRFFSAGTGKDVTKGGKINGPLGLAIAPNGDILTVNGNDGNIVETTPDGNQVAVRLLDNTSPVPTGGAGTLFGVAVVPGGRGVYFVDDGDNTLRILH
jgi:sugar lactone lactonase YvrE